MATTQGRTSRPPAKAARGTAAPKPTKKTKAGPEPVNIAAAGRQALRGKISKPTPIGVRDDGRIGQTLRLMPDDWKRLKRLAAEEMKPTSHLMIEALNLLFKARKLPPLEG